MIRPTSYPGTVRQLIVTGLGRDAPTVIITNDDITTRALIGQYARRMTIEQRLAEIIQAFCADAPVFHGQPQRRPRYRALVLAQALLTASRARLGAGYHAATPDTLQRHFLDTPGTSRILTLSSTGDAGLWSSPAPCQGTQVALCEEV